MDGSELFKRIIFLSATAFILGCADQSKRPDIAALAEREGAAGFEEVASFPGQQVTGITVSKNGRIFANFPRWRETVQTSVVEIKPDGTWVPYPNLEWNAWSGKPKANTFTCVQSVVAHGDSLFVLDPSSPEIKGVVGRPTLYEFNLKNNSLKRKWTFNELVAPPRSYLNDLRVDDKRKLIYMTESGLGALIVLDMRTGKSRRVLDRHPSTKSEPVVLYPNGKAVTKVNGMPAKFHADGIELVKDYVYYHAVTAKKFYRIPASALANSRLSHEQLAKKVEYLGETPSPDGLIADRNGNIYMADIERNAVVVRNKNGQITDFLRDEHLHWADTFAIHPEGFLLFTDSRLDQTGPGRPADQYIFRIYRVALNQEE